MYKRDFDTLLNKSLPKCVLLYGDNKFLLDYYAKFYKEKLYAKETLLEQNYDEYNFDKAKGYLSQSSLFGGINLLIVRSDKKIPKKELDKLIELTKQNEFNYFLYIYEGTSSNARSLQSSFSDKKGGIWVRFFEPNFKEAMDFANLKARQLNLNISSYALSHLVNLLNLDMSLIDKEIEKLSILEQEISIKDIDNLVYSTAPLAVESVIISLFNKEDVTQTIHKLTELGEDEFALLRAIQRFLQQLFLFRAYIQLNGSPNSKEILGYALPKKIEEQRASLAIKIKSSTFLKIYQELLDLELNMKTHSSNKESLFYGGLLKIRHLL